jgi:hypothetical protein
MSQVERPAYTEREADFQDFFPCRNSCREPFPVRKCDRGSGFSAKGKRAVNQTLGKYRWPFRAGLGPKSGHGQEDSGFVAEGFFLQKVTFFATEMLPEGFKRLKASSQRLERPASSGPT